MKTKQMEITRKVKNIGPELKSGTIVQIVKPKSRWIRLLIWLKILKPRIKGFIYGVDTEGFKGGDTLYLDPDKPGTLIAK